MLQFIKPSEKKYCLFIPMVLREAGERQYDRREDPAISARQRDTEKNTVKVLQESEL
jgi:hypothetical protein